MSTIPTENIALLRLDATDIESNLQVEAFVERLANRTAVRVSSAGQFYTSNPERARVLLDLIQEIKPLCSMEIGTGRGYGCLTMALGLVLNGLPGKIISIDRLAPDVEQPWIWRDGEKFRVDMRSLNSMWRTLPGSIVSRVQLLTGKSFFCMRRWLLSKDAPNVAFAFIDGAHDLFNSRCDFFGSVLAAKGGPITILVDDYGGAHGQKVKYFVDNDLVRWFPQAEATIIEMPASAAELSEEGKRRMVIVRVPPMKQPAWAYIFFFYLGLCTLAFSGLAFLWAGCRLAKSHFAKAKKS